MSATPEPPLADLRMQLDMRAVVDSLLREGYEIVSRHPMRLEFGTMLYEIAYNGAAKRIPYRGRHA